MPLKTWNRGKMAKIGKKPWNLGKNGPKSKKIMESWKKLGIVGAAGAWFK